MARRWSWSAGPYGCTVRVAENAQGIIYLDFTDRTKKHGRAERSLGRISHDAAVQAAKQKLAELLTTREAQVDETPTLARLLGEYLKEHTPTKKPHGQRMDQQRAELFCRFWGGKTDISAITPKMWKQIERDRTNGIIDARGRRVPVEGRRTVRPGTVGDDLRFLQSVAEWATKWVIRGRTLLEHNPLRKFSVPRTINVRRPIITHDRYLAVRDVCVGWSKQGGTRGRHGEYLRGYIDLLNATGRRADAVAQLRWADILWDEGKNGAIHWQAETDKLGREWIVPMGDEVRSAVLAIAEERPGVGEAPLFPQIRNPGRPVSDDQMSEWYLRAEREAGLKKLDGSLLHGFRRKFATERKHWPVVDVAYAGGWKDVATVLAIYQQADPESVQKAIDGPKRVYAAA